MLKRFFIFSVVLFAAAQSASAAWYDSAWDFRIEVSSDNVLVADDEVDVPLYLDLSLLGAHFFDNVQIDGSDLIITSDDEVTPLSYELVDIDTVSETGELHFLADSLSDLSDTSFYVYYGNSGTNTFVSNNIWDAFRGVWHFDEDPSSDSGTRGVATQSAMDGGDGSWALWHGDNPIGSSLSLANDEDQVGDAERGHTTEQVAYWVFGPGISSIVDKDGVIIGETGLVDTTGASVVDVDLLNTYVNPVIVATAQYNGGVPAVVRIDNVAVDSFDVSLQNPEPSASAGTPDDAEVYYTVIEAGSYLLPGNIPVEAGTETVTGFNRSGSWSSAQMLNVVPTHTYVNPVVLGSVMSFNNSQWQTFWSSNGSAGSPPTAGSIYIGRHTGAESSPTVVNETLAYIIVEQHAGTNAGVESRAQLGADSVRGVTNSAPYYYPGLTALSGAGVFQDSTVNNFYTDSIGGVSSATSSQIGRGVDLDGVASRLPISGLNYTNNNSLDKLTASFWLNTTDTPRSGIFDFDRSEYWQLGLNFHNASGDAGRISFDTASSSGGIEDLNSSAFVNDGDWHHVVAVFDKDDPTDKKIYIDGVLDVAVDQYSSSLGRGTTRYGFFGDGSEASVFAGNSNDYPVEALIDEARIEHTARDAEWILTSFNNQNDNASFWDVSSPEQQNLPPLEPTSLYFNHTDAQSGLVNPVDIEIGGGSGYVPYMSALYHGDGDTATRAYVQVSTDSSFSSIDYWDSGWFDLPSIVSDADRSSDLEYGDLALVGASAPLLPLVMDDGLVTYYWRIAFEDDSGLQGPFSSPASFSILDLASAPDNISATKVEASPDTFIVNWQDTSLSETSFEVEFQEDTGAGFAAWQAVSLPSPSPTPANTVSWDMHNTVGNAAYKFRVRSCNYAGCSVWVEDPLTHFTDPEAPVNVCAEYVSDTDFQITWENRSLFDLTSIEQCDGFANCAAASFTSLATMAAEPGPVGSVGTAVNEIYRWSSYADNGVVSSDPTYTNFEYTSPSAPTTVEAVRVSDSIIALSWVDTSLYEDGFRVYVSIDGGAYNEITPGVNTTAANANVYTYTEAEAGHDYQFDVRAHISQTVCGSITNDELLSTSALSNLVSTTPDAPLISVTSYVSDADISVSWIDTSINEDGFNVYVRMNDGAWGLAGSVAANTTSYTYTAGVADAVYDFYIEAYVDLTLPGNPIGLSNTEGPAEFRRIYTSPLAPVLSLNGVSSGSIDWGVADAASYELGFSVYDSSNNFIQLIPSPNLSGFTESGLTPNTMYDRYLRSYVDNSGALVDSVNSNTISLYTLANSPSDLAVVETVPGSIDLTWMNGGNPLGTEFSIENTQTGLSSGWVPDLLSWSETGLSCGSLYEFRVKARNNDLVETGEELIELETEACPETGSSSVKYVCKDESALNYSSFGKHKSSLCEYNDDNEDDLKDEVFLNDYVSEGVCSAINVLTQNLQKGDRDGKYSTWESGLIKEVSVLQSHMNRLGFRSGVEDGIFGPVTYAAVKRMQAVLGTIQDGFVGVLTRQLINNSCHDDSHVQEFEPKNETPQCRISYTRLIQKGLVGEDVKQVQLCMNSLGYSTGIVDGWYGENTYRGITQYQKDQGLQYVDGIVGKETVDALNS